MDKSEKNGNNSTVNIFSEAGRLYEQLIENAKEAIFIAQDNTLKYVNPATTKLTGYTKEEMYSRQFIDFIYTEDRNIVMENHLSRIRGDYVPHIYQFRIINKDGTIRWIELNAILFYWNGKPATLNFVTDITENKQAEKLILQLNHKYEDAMQAANMAYWELDITTGVFYFNQRFYNMHGIQLSNAGDYKMSMKVFMDKYIAPESSAEFKHFITKAIVSEDPDFHEQIEIQMLRENHEKFWVNVWLFVEKEHDNLFKKIHGINQDITERKADEELIKSGQVILSLAAELSQLGPWDYDFKTGSFTFNDEFYKIYRTSAAIEGLIMPMEKYAKEFVHPDDAFIVKQEIDKALENKNPEYTTRLEHRIICRDGEIRIIAVLARVIRNSMGEIIKWYGANQDITDQKHAEESLRRLISEKEILLKELQHRVKNNMNIIASLLHLGMDKIRDDDARNIFADAISRINSMSAIYEQLYSSKNLDRIDLNVYIKSLTDSIFRTYNFDSTTGRLITTLDDVKLDLKRLIPLGLILNELITNSLKYAYPGTMNGEIRVSLHKSDDLLILSVSDDGIGMPDDFNIEDSASMGLMLVSILTRQIDGNLKINSENGTTTSIYFKHQDI